MKKKLRAQKKFLLSLGRASFWFFVGAALGLFFFISFLFIFFQKFYDNKIYPGITINNVNFGGKTKDEVAAYFLDKNDRTSDAQFTFKTDTDTATISAKQLNAGYDQDLIADQAYSIGRSSDLFSNLTLVLQSYIYNINLPVTYKFSVNSFDKVLTPIADKNKIDPVNALFKFENGRVIAFSPSSDGQEIDKETVKRNLLSKIPTLLKQQSPQTITIPVPIKILKPTITTDKANNLGITELIASGTSLFQHSIESRIFNLTLAASRVNGVLVAPGEVFSFASAIGDVSAFTGYKQAYVIQNGRTVLGDGGGICQVSTTLFRAVLNAGLPVVERNAHAYRVGYYEQDSPPGIDATVYVPSVDFKFKNDTANYILIQTAFDPSVERLTFMLYGTKDNREVTLSKPVITSQTPAPPPLYQDDPTLPKGVEKQVDFAAAGANVYFTREVKKNGAVIIADKFVSNYRPWQAVYLRGTKE